MNDGRPEETNEPASRPAQRIRVRRFPDFP